MNKALLMKLESGQNPIPALQGFMTECQSTFAEMAAKVPEPFRAQLAALKKSADDFLVGLQSRPTDQVPAAQEANWALQRMVSAFAWIGEQQEGLIKLMGEMSSKYAGATAELQGLQTLREQKEKGELVEAGAVQAKVEAALKTERERQAMLSVRRLELQSASLPIPGDAVLAVEEKAFAETKAAAAKRLKELSELGVELSSAELVDVVYGGQAEYDRLAGVARKLKPGAGGGQKAPEPLAGSGEGAGAKKSRVMVC